jgi:hypothetical protein
MKLLFITSVKAFKDDIKAILKVAKVGVYSYNDVAGFMNTSGMSNHENWFASDIIESESVLFYAIVKKECVQNVFDAVEKFNKVQESKSSIHLAVINIEQSN